MQRNFVGSSDIRSIGYENNTLEIEFNHGGIYQYHGVPYDRYCNLINSSSSGNYFRNFIKPFYYGIKIG